MFCHVKTKPFVMLTDGNEFPRFWMDTFFLLSFQYSEQGKIHSQQNVRLKSFRGQMVVPLRPSEATSLWIIRTRPEGTCTKSLQDSKTKIFSLQVVFLSVEKKVPGWHQRWVCAPEQIYSRLENILAFSF